LSAPKIVLAHAPSFVGVFAAPSADPFLRGWEGGVSARGGVFGGDPDAAAASRKLRGVTATSRRRPYCEPYSQGYPEAYQVHNKVVGKAEGKVDYKFRQR